MVLYTSAQTHHQGHISIKRNATSQTIAKSIMKAWHNNHTVNVLTLSLLKINTQNLIHVNLLSIRLVNKTSWFSRCTSARKTNLNHSAHPALCVTYTITARQRDLSDKRRAGNGCEPWFHTAWIHTKHKQIYANLQLGLLLHPDLLALAPYKN